MDVTVPPLFVSVSVSVSGLHSHALEVVFHFNNSPFPQVRSKLNPEPSADRPAPVATFTASVPLVVIGPPVNPAPEPTEVTVPPELVSVSAEHSQTVEVVFHFKT